MIRNSQQRAAFQKRVGLTEGVGRAFERKLATAVRETPDDTERLIFLRKMATAWLDAAMRAGEAGT